jgi:hypothetical protein
MRISLNIKSTEAAEDQSSEVSWGEVLIISLR